MYILKSSIVAQEVVTNRRLIWPNLPRVFCVVISELDPKSELNSSKLDQHNFLFIKNQKEYTEYSAL